MENDGMRNNVIWDYDMSDLPDEVKDILRVLYRDNRKVLSDLMVEVLMIEDKLEAEIRQENWDRCYAILKEAVYDFANKHLERIDEQGRALL